MSRLTASNITVVCDEIQVSEYDVVISIVSGTLGLLGLVYCFFGRLAYWQTVQDDYSCIVTFTYLLFTKYSVIAFVDKFLLV